MKLTDIIYISLNGARERKFRFALNLLGILIGCTAITGLISVTQGLNSSISEQLEILGVNTMIIVPMGTGGDSYVPSTQIITSPVSLSWRDKMRIEQFTAIESVSAMQQKYCTYELRGKKYVGQIFGIDHTIFEINNNYAVEHGRTLNRHDKASIIIGAKIAHPESEDEPILAVGDRIRIKTVGTSEEKEMTFRIVGIMKETGGMAQMSPDNMLLIPIRTSEQLFDSPGEYDIIQAKVKTFEEMDIVAEQIKNDVEDIIIITPESIRTTVNEITNTIESVLLGIDTISLIVAGVGIINTMTVSVNERIKEIGVLKALGAKNLDVLLMFLFEASYTGLSGGFIGGLVGFFLGRSIGEFIGMPIEASAQLFLFVIGFALITSVLAGAWPAWRAAKLNPVDALRNE